MITIVNKKIKSKTNSTVDKNEVVLRKINHLNREIFKLDIVIDNMFK